MKRYFSESESRHEQHEKLPTQYWKYISGIIVLVGTLVTAGEIVRALRLQNQRRDQEEILCHQLIDSIAQEKTPEISRARLCSNQQIRRCVDDLEFCP